MPLPLKESILTPLLSEFAVFSELGEVRVGFLLVDIVATRVVVASVTGATSIAGAYKGNSGSSYAWACWEVEQWGYCPPAASPGLMEVPDQPPTHKLITMRAEEEIQREKGGSPYLSD